MIEMRCKPCLGEGKARGDVWGGSRPSAIFHFHAM